jgi:hypothetical protein
LTARAAGLLLAIFIASAPPAAAAAAIQTALPQFLPIPGPAPTPITPAPLPPPINPGYVAAPPNGLSPLLTQPGPVYELPAPASPSYPAPQLPGPVDQQKMQSYRNDLLGQQWRLQRNGVSPSSLRSREIQQQLNAPDPQ